MTDQQHDGRMRMPGEGPTDEDLRHDVELTRQELAATVAALGAKADVKNRVRDAAQRRTEAITTAVRSTVSRRPTVPLAGLAALVAVLLAWLIRRH